MRYWVFNEQQLTTALAAFASRYSAPEGEATVRTIVLKFLTSPEAREHKLQGGASWGPEAQG